MSVKDKLAKIQDQKQELLKEVLAGPETRYEKLETIEKHNLMEWERWIQHPFANTEHMEKFIKMCEEKPEASGYVCKIADDIFRDGDYGRGAKVNLSYFFEESGWFEEGNDPEEAEEYYNKEIVVLTNRGRDVVRYTMTNKEFLDFLWNWIVENDTIGWHFDW